MKDADRHISELAEYLRKEAKRWRVVGPRYYEGWEIMVSVPEYLQVRGVRRRWSLSARRRNRKTPSDNDIKWLTTLAKQLSEGKSEGPFEKPKDPKDALLPGGIQMTHYYVWFLDDEEEPIELEENDEYTDLENDDDG